MTAAPDHPPLDEEVILARAAAAVARVDLWGRRAVTSMSFEDIEAMALAVVILAHRIPVQTPIQTALEGETP